MGTVCSCVCKAEHTCVGAVCLCVCEAEHALAAEEVMLTLVFMGE